MAHDVDILLIKAALQHAGAQDGDFSINALCSSIFDSSLLEMLAEIPHDPKEIIVEILEYQKEDDYVFDAGRLQDLKKMGYRLALDDFNPMRPGEKERLERFGPYADYIKIDGPVVRKALEDEPDLLPRIFSVLQESFPDARIIAEHIQTPGEANHVFSLGAYVVQGCFLKSEEMLRQTSSPSRVSSVSAPSAAFV